MSLVYPAGRGEQELKADARCVCRAIQRRRHDILQRWAETNQRDIGDLKSTVSQSTMVLLSGQNSVAATYTQMATAVREQIYNKNADGVPSESARTEQSDLQHEYRNLKKIHRRQRKFLARITTPPWCTSYRLALEFGGHKAPNGWNFSIKTYAVIPRSSPIFRSVSDGDMEAVQRLFGEGLASPFDRSREGETILDVSLTPTYSEAGC